MTKEPDDIMFQSWARLTRVQHTIFSAIEAALKKADLPPLSWYDVLLELSRVRNVGMRPFELEAKLLLPQYGLSRLLDKIEAAGLIEKQPYQGDGRGQTIMITEKGQTMRARMWPVYAASIAETVDRKVSLDEARQLYALLGKLNS